MLKRFILTVALGLCLSSAARAQIINAATCNASDVQTALNSITTDGTTVVVPSGSCTWSVAVTHTQTKSFTLQAAGAISGTGSLSTIGGTGSDLTTISNGLSSGAAILVITTAASKTFRLTGFAFTTAAGNLANPTFNGLLFFGGASTAVRVDHNHFNQICGAGFTIDGIQGVGDHNQFDLTQPAGCSTGGFQTIFRKAGASNHGDESWNDTDHFGTTQTFYLETNNYQSVPANTTTHGWAFDCQLGGRGVFRNNAVGFHVALQTHGTGSGGADNRGCRALEVYNNVFQWSSAPATDNFAFLVQQEGGTGLWWGNTMTGFVQYVHADTVRTNNATYGEVATPGGWGFCNSTPIAGVAGPSAWDSGSYPCLDQNGRGKGDLLTGNAPSKVDSITGTITWPNQVLDPMYVWKNTFNRVGFGSDAYFAPDRVAVENTDYYLELPNPFESQTFNGTAGIGQGVLSARPTTCTPNVGWWATDTTTFYVCTSANTWTNYYTPLIYPHPLTSTSWTAVAESLSSANCNGATTCSTFGPGDVIPTTAGTVRIMVVEADCSAAGNCSNGHITSVTGGGASWTVCPNCFASMGGANGEQKDMAYSISCPTTTNCGVGGGFSNFTVNIAGAANVQFRMWLYEFMPPAGFVASFDTSGVTGVESCPGALGICQGVALGARTATDLIFQTRIKVGAQTWNSWSAPYYQTFFANAANLNDSTGVAPTLTTGIANNTGAISAIAFKSTAGLFTPPTQHMKAVNYVNYGKNIAPPTNTISCNPTCSVTIPSTTKGNLLYLLAGDINNAFISTVTDSAADAWVVPTPTGITTCRNSTSNQAISCAYVLSAAGSTTQLTVTMSGNGSVAFAEMEVQPIGVTFGFDAQASAINAASFVPKGPTLAVTGTDDAIFQAAFIPGGTTAVSFYPFPQSSPSLGNEFFEGQGGFGALMDATSAPVPVWGDQQNNVTVTAGIAFSATPASSGSPVVSLSPTSLSFANQTVATTSATQIITLTNTGTASLTITSITITGTNSGDFPITANACGASLGAGSTCSVTMTFVPVAQGVRNASVTFSTNAPTSPDNVVLAGTGVVSNLINGAGTISGSGTIHP